MEDLFSVTLNINNQPVKYQVVFDHEAYIFTEASGAQGLPVFSFRRGHDEWQDQQPAPPELRMQALEALERYLLKQH
jgi:hypothetical protein